MRSLFAFLGGVLSRQYIGREPTSLRHGTLCFAPRPTSSPLPHAPPVTANALLAFGVPVLGFWQVLAAKCVLAAIRSVDL